MQRRFFRPMSAGRRRCLTFAPMAWLKMMWFCHAGDTEVGGFGLTAPGRPLYVTDFLTLPQEVTAVSVRFPDEAVADFFDQQADRGLAPDRFARIWLHTHPGTSARPSMVDEDTFHAAFGSCDWSLMAIVSRTGNTYARLRMAAGPSATIRLGVTVDWAGWPTALANQPEGLDLLIDQWRRDYVEQVRLPQPDPTILAANTFGATDMGWGPFDSTSPSAMDGWNIEPLEEMAWPK